jgi:hypothetical protein
MQNRKMPNVLTKDQMDKHEGIPYLTVGEIKKFIKDHDLPDNSKVLIERVEDFYYDENNWSVYPKNGYLYYSHDSTNKRMREEIERRANGEEPEYEMENPEDYIYESDDLDKSQYTPAFCCVKFEEDDILFINLHY